MYFSAKRLFSLLPPRMPLSAKFSLVENLWEHFGPRSKEVLRIGLAADLDMIMGAVLDHVENVVANYKIPDNLEKRFTWLSAGEVHVKREILNCFRQKGKALAVEARACEGSCHAGTLAERRRSAHSSIRRSSENWQA